MNKSVLIRISLLICLAVHAGPAQEDNAVIEGSLQQSRLELFDEENKKIFLQKRVLFEQREKQRKLRITIATEALLYDMNLEVAAEIMLRYDLQSKMAVVAARKDSIEKATNVEGEEYAKLLMKIQSVKARLDREGIEVKSEMINSLDDEISRTKRKLKGDALKRVMDYEKKRTDDIVAEVLRQPQTDAEKAADAAASKEDKKREMLEELAGLAGKSDGTTDAVPVDRLQDEVVNLIQKEEFTRNVEQLTIEAEIRRAQVRQQYETERELYENIRQKVAALKIFIKRRDLIRESSSEEKRRMARREYRNILKHFNNEEHLLAAVKIEHLFKAYPEFDDVSTATFMLAECKLALHHYDEAEQLYLTLLKDFPQSTYFSLALYRLLDINYLYGNYSKIVEYQKLFVPREINDAVLMGILYMTGRSHYFLTAYGTAREVLGRITNTIDYYPAAQYMIGLACLQQDSLALASDFFKKCAATAQPGMKNSLPMKQLFDDAVIAVGHLAFQQGQLKDALQYYAMASEDALGADQVVAGKMWVAFKQEIPEYDRVVLYAKRLVQRYPFSRYSYEAQIMQAVAFAKLGLNDDAARIYGDIIALQEGRALLATYTAVRKRLGKLVATMQRTEAEAIVRNEPERFVHMKRTVRGLDSTYTVMNQCAQYLYNLFPVEKIRDEIIHLRDQTERTRKALGSYAAMAHTMGAELEDIEKIAQRVKDEKVLTRAEQERSLVNDLNAQINEIDQQISHLRIRTNNASLEKAIERSRAGQLDLEFMTDQEKRDRIQEIRTLTRSIDEILEKSTKKE